MPDDTPPDSDPEERARTLELLRDQHEFPGRFGFRVVIRPGLRATVVQAVAAVVDEDALDEVHERSSRKGNYVALRLSATMASAEQVLEVYAVLQRVDGVLTVL